MMMMIKFGIALDVSIQLANHYCKSLHDNEYHLPDTILFSVGEVLNSIIRINQDPETDDNNIRLA